MLFNHLPVAFPWYDKLEKQTYYKAGDEYNFPHLISPKDAVLPFMFRRPTTSLLPTTWDVYRADGTHISDLSQYILDLGTRTLEGYDYFWFVRDLPMIIGDPITNTLDPGCIYYMVMTFPSGLPAYSETFTVPLESFSVNVPADCKFIKIEWENDGDISPIFYPAVAPLFLNRVFLDSRILASEPEIEEEVERDGNNIDVPLFQRAAIRYRIPAFVPDFLKVALSVMPLHDTKTLTTEYGLESGEMLAVTVESGTEEGGFTATADILFEQDLLVLNKGCTEGMELDDCPPAPAPGTVSMSTFENPVGVTLNLIATGIPAGVTYVDIIGYDIGGDYTIASKVPPAALGGSGYPIDFADYPGITAWGIALRNFNCVIQVISEAI